MVNDWLFETILWGGVLLSMPLAVGVVWRMLAVKGPASDTRDERRTAREQWATLVLEQVGAAIWLSSLDGARLLFANAACERIFGAAPQAYPPGVEGEAFERHVHPEDELLLQQALAARAAGNGYEVNYRSVHGGHEHYIRETGRIMCDAQGVPQYFISSALDISSEMAVRDELHGLNNLLRETNQRLRENARRDNLTQCLNRAAFFDQAEKALHMEQRYGRSSTLIFFDLNDFKQLNDNFGHHIGDRGLIGFAGQIKERLRATDELGRYGGDEFVVLLRETDAAQAQQLLNSLLPVVIDAGNGNSIILRYSAGIACSNESDIESVDDWLRCADSQMYHQKMRRRSG
jgi:diguanylate cyclase (GGDEF)-like protein/PAS domain S-box-containing protein